MKKIILSLLLCFVFTYANSQTVTINSHSYNAATQDLTVNFTVTGTLTGHNNWIFNLKNHISGSGSSGNIALSPASTSLTSIVIPNAEGYRAVIIKASQTGTPNTASQRYAFGMTLPVTWAAFEAKSQEYGNKLTWKTSTEINTDYFEVEHSQDGTDFVTASDKIAAAGNSTDILEYNFTHKDFSNYAYYRIKQVDIDAKYDYSETIVVKRDQEEEFQVRLYPVPMHNDNIINLEMRSLDKSAITVSITDISGELVREVVYGSENGYLEKQIDMNFLNSGVYFFEVENFQGSKSFKIVK